MDIYRNLINLAKSIRYQNLFQASKEINGINLFKNNIDFSKLQNIFLNYLYMFNTLNTDIIVEKISKHVLDDEIYWESYMIWKRKNNTIDKKRTDKELHLVIGNTIKFPKKEVN